MSINTCKKLLELVELNNHWKPVVVPKEIKYGDMPKDKVNILDAHIKRAELIFPRLLSLVKEQILFNQQNKIVISVCGGSGVGKSEIASLLSFYFSEMGINSYTLSGDNYPYRIPLYNDAERLRVFRESGLKGMIKEGTYTKERFQIIQDYQEQMDDANEGIINEHTWFYGYIKQGKKGLAEYLGSKQEIDFTLVEQIIKEFKNKKEKIWLKRMGRTETELWFEEVDFSHTNILILEWTHGNSDQFKGVDIPLLLNSTPEETLAHRRERNRDHGTELAFTKVVLELEQELLKSQAKKAKMIMSKEGKQMSFLEYQAVMQESERKKDE